jgi:hypothetical protein
MTLSKYDRFDLEQAIMVAWGTCEDIDLIYHNTDNFDLNAEDCDNLQNQLLGLRSITELRFEKMWHIFEELIKHQKLEVYLDDVREDDKEYMSMLRDIDNLKGMVK